MKKLRLILPILALLILTAGEPRAQARPEALTSSQELLRMVSQSRGKVVVINFWASWCGPCRQEIPELIALRKRFGEDKLVILGVSVDQDAIQYSQYVSRAGFNYPVYRAQPDVSMAFSIRAIPRTIVYSQKGEVFHTQEGFLPGADLERMVKKLLGA